MTRKLLIMGVMAILLLFATAGYATTPSSVGNWLLSADNPLPGPPPPNPFPPPTPNPFPPPPPMEMA